MIRFEDVSSYGALIKAADECTKNVRWKSSTQMFEVNKMRWAQSLSKELMNGTYKSRGFNNFIIHERGKIRRIQSVHITERCVQKSLCQNALKPLIIPRLIYDNSASLKGKGTSFAVRRLKHHLYQHYKKHGRTGGILLMDYSNYFASINHEMLLKMLRRIIEDDRVYALTKHFIDCFEGECGLGLGSEISQISAIYYTNSIDHHIKERLHIKGYGRYMDDSYIIHEDIEYLKYCLKIVEIMSEGLGLKLNMKRTQIVPLTSHFEYLKRRVHLTETGKVIMRPTRKNITKRRRTLRKQKALYDNGEIDVETIRQSYRSWRGYIEKCNAYKTIKSTDELFGELFGKENE